MSFIKLSNGKAINGKIRLINLHIDALQSLYGHVLKSNNGNSEAMTKVVMAILHHYSSTEEDSQHRYCPACETSWRKFQVDKYNGGHTYKPVKEPILNAVKEFILPVCETLGNQKFLNCCKNNMSSKPNEAYHNVLWGLPAKDSYFSTHLFFSFNWHFAFSIVEFYGHIRNQLMNVGL